MPRSTDRARNRDRGGRTQLKHPSHLTWTQMRVKEHNRRGKLPDQKSDVSKVVLKAKPDVKARAAAWNLKRACRVYPPLALD